MRSLGLPYYVAVLDLPTLHAVALFTAFWLGLLALAWLSPLPLDFKRQHAERGASTIHALVASVGSVLTWTLEPTACLVPHFRHHWMRLFLLITGGYLAMDMINMLIVDVWQKWRKVDYASLFHHALVLGCIFIATELNFGLWFQASLLINELPVVPLNVVQVMRFFRLQHLEMYSLMKVGTGVLWVVCRLAAIPVSFWRLRVLKGCREDWGLPCTIVAGVSYSLLWLLNIYWFWKLAQGARRPFDAESAQFTDSALLEPLGAQVAEAPADAKDAVAHKARARLGAR